MDVALTVATVALAATAFWYAWETRQQRLQNSEHLTVLREQMEILREQARSSVAPSLILALREPEAGSKFAALLSNPTDKVGQNAWMWIYDSGTKSFLKSDYGLELIKPLLDNVPRKFSGEYLSIRELWREVDETYDHSFASVQDRFSATGAKSYIALTFFDVAGNAILVKRQFESEEDGYSYYRDGVYYASDFASPS